MLSAQRHVKHKVRAIINAKPEAESYGPFLELMFPPLPSAEAASAAAAAGCSPSTFTYLHYLSHTLGMTRAPPAVQRRNCLKNSLN